MEIPYYDKERPDTGLYNGKAGIWLFLASEVMLFGALFSAYVLLRVGAEPGTWSMGLMNQWVGAFNTLILIASSATIVMAWVCLKLNDWKGFRKWKWATVIFAFTFLVVKWSYEWPAKFTHYDITFTNDEAANRVYTEVLGPMYSDQQREAWEKRFDPMALSAKTRESMKFLIDSASTGNAFARRDGINKNDEAWRKRFNEWIENFGIEDEKDLRLAALGPSESERLVANAARFPKVFELLGNTQDNKEWPKLRESALNHFEISDESGLQEFLRRLKSNLEEFAIKNDKEMENFAARINKYPEPFQRQLANQNFNKVQKPDMPLDGHIVGYIDSEDVEHKVGAAWGVPFWSHAFAWRHDRKNIEKEKDKSIRYDEDDRPVYKEGHFRDTFRDKDIKAIILVPAHGTWDPKEKHANSGTVKYAEAKHDGGHAHSDEHGHTVTIAREDISRLSSYEPAHSTFFATYYTLTGLHALHVLGGILVMLYHLLPVSRRVYEKNPVQFTNRIEITGLFWHFVDLVWIFLFPILYLM
jgi:heme/copper-type cytochrome/quinol oxidase subunit 3